MATADEIIAEALKSPEDPKAAKKKYAEDVWRQHEDVAPETPWRDLLTELPVDYLSMLTGGAGLGLAATGTGAGALAAALKYGGLGFEKPISRAIAKGANWLNTPMKAAAKMPAKFSRTAPMEASIMKRPAGQFTHGPSPGEALIRSPRGMPMETTPTINIPDFPGQPGELMGQAQGQIAGAIERKALKASPRGAKRFAEQKPAGPFDAERIPTQAERLIIKQKLASDRAQDIIEELLGAHLRMGGF